MTESVVAELVDKYLVLIHDRPHSLFHCATLWRDIQNNTICKHLVYAICSLGASLSEDPELRQLGPRLSTTSKALLLASIEDVNLENIQTCILLANIFAADLNPASETLFFGIANRMAQIMRLHSVDEKDCAVLREVKRRTWWTLVMADNWCSNGLGIPRQLESQSTNLELPMDEYVFQRASINAAQAELDRPERGLWAYMMTLVSIFGPIYDLNRRLVESQLAEDVIEHHVRDLSRRLDAWEAGLPEHMHLTDANLDHHISKGLGGPFVALHIGYYHYSTVLYFQYLDLRRPRTPTTEAYADRCKGYALAYSRLLADARSKGTCKAVYATVGHLTVISSSVLLHILLFGHDDEVAEVRNRLTTNFAALIDLKQYWPSLERTVSAQYDFARVLLTHEQIARLSVFQIACLNSTRLNTHHIDQWMVRFLLEHSLPLEDRPEEATEESILGPMHPDEARTLAADDAIAYLYTNVS